MENQPNNCEGFARSLGLQPGHDELFAGKRRGFPIGLKFIEPQGAVLFLFQIRHWLTENAPQVKSLAYDAEIAQLLAEKKIEMEFGDRIAWLTLVDLGPRVELETVNRILNSILSTFDKAGFIGDPDLCHYCQKEKVTDLSAADGKVAQICSACLEERVKKKGRDTAAPSAEAVPILLLTPFAAVVGALLWAVCWAAHNYIMQRLTGDMVIMPRLLIAIVVVFIGMAVGLPIGGTIRMNRRRGAVVSGSAAIAFAALAVLFGELLYLAWLIWRWYGVFSLAMAARVFPDYYGASGPFFVAMKFLAGVIGVIVAYEMSKPRKAALKL